MEYIVPEVKQSLLLLQTINLQPTIAVITHTVRFKRCNDNSPHSRQQRCFQLLENHLMDQTIHGAEELEDTSGLLLWLKPTREALPANNMCHFTFLIRLRWFICPDVWRVNEFPPSRNSWFSPVIQHAGFRCDRLRQGSKREKEARTGNRAMLPSE